jgi:hypothetical protein
MSDVAVSVSQLGKRYRIGQLPGGYELLSERVSQRLRTLGRPKGPAASDF